jgi:hypothetical protein
MIGEIAQRCGHAPDQFGLPANADPRIGVLGTTVDLNVGAASSFDAGGNGGTGTIEVLGVNLWFGF